MIKILLLALILVGCSQNNDVAQVSGIRNAEFIPYIVNIPANREKSKGEENYCMSGASIENEHSFKSIKSFEKAIGIENNVYIAEIEDGGEFPGSFVIEAISLGKTPMLIIRNETNMEKIKDIALKCNGINAKIFVALDYGSSVNLYSEAANIFRKISHNTALMWHINLDYSLDEAPLSNEYDWVSIEFKGNTFKSYREDLVNYIKYFNNKAVAVIFSIEYFSEDDHKYYTNEWNNIVNEIYSLSEDYENLSLISYADNSESNRAYGSARLSDSKIIQGYYRDAVKSLAKERGFSSTDYIAYVSNDTAYVDINIADKLNIDRTYANYKYIAFKNYTLDSSERKIYLTNIKKE